MHPKPFIKEWEKPDITEEMRDNDSRDCGGGWGRQTPGSPGFRQKDIEAEHFPEENEDAAFYRLRHKWERCILNKGYQYTGECSYSGMRSLPACGAP